ncbi:hypothetical protein WK28_05730 [Burkholderia vietnamiensis]|nr:hypothetical protein WK28_05730 [Burkholderia vietnamiensis]
MREVRRIAAPAVSRLVLAGLPSGGLSAEEIDIVFAADFDEEADEVLPCLTRLLQDFELVVEVMCLDEHAASARIEVVNE